MNRTIPAGAFLLVTCCVALMAATKPTAEDIIKQHREEGLNSAVLPAGQVREVRGSAQLTTPAKAVGALAGSFHVTSTAGSSRVTLQFKTDLYEGETWATDGQNVEIGFAQPRTSSRSALGIFLSVNTPIVVEGLLGGVLNARWPLLDVAGRGAKVSYEGLKKLGGRELHRLRYRASQHQGPLDVLIFLEPDTYRHIATVYTTSQAQGMGQTPESSSQQQDLVFRLEEWFSDFERFGAITIPKAWTLHYERSGNTTSEWKYELRLEHYEEHEQNAGRPGRSVSLAPSPYIG
jgi:hypothetical protein